jgi:hypothetical protein
MNLKKLVPALFLVSAFSFVNLSCTSPGSTQVGTVFIATLRGSQEIPPTNSTALGTATLTLSDNGKSALVTYDVKGLLGTESGAHIHGPAKVTESAEVLFPLTGPSTIITLNDTQLKDLRSGLYYVNVHSDKFPAGEVRGQLTSK